MSKRISEKKAREIRKSFMEVKNFRKIAKLHNVSRWIARRVVMREGPYGTASWTSGRSETMFRPVSPRPCLACSRFHGRVIEVAVSPCPACAARRAKQRHERRAAGGIQCDKKQRWPQQADGEPLNDVPEYVVDWIHEMAASMVSKSGHPLEAREAVEQFVDRFYWLAQSIFLTTAEIRRRAHVKEGVDTSQS